MAFESPHGFKSTASGLIVPEPLAREREVWTDAERRLIDRVVTLVNRRGLRMLLRCTDPQCQAEPLMTRVDVPGGFELRCGHKARVFLGA